MVTFWQNDGNKQLVWLDMIQVNNQILLNNMQGSFGSTIKGQPSHVQCSLDSNTYDNNRDRERD